MNDNDVELRLEKLLAGAPVVSAPVALRKAVLADRARERAGSLAETAGGSVGPASRLVPGRHGRLGRIASALAGLAATFALCAGLLFLVAQRPTTGPASSAAPGTFSLTGSMSAPRYMHAAVLLGDGRVLVVGGWADVVGPRLATAELYDPATGEFSATGSMAHARANPTATLLPDGRVLVTGGDLWRGEADSSAELYDPATGTFTATGSMAVARAGETATLLADGRVLIVGGGENEGSALASGEVYDPATGTFSATGSMAQARLGHTAALLRDGRVLVAGGEYGSTGSLASAELYDPATGTFSLTGLMADARTSTLATTLADGRVLLAGGQGNAGDRAAAEVYDPGTGAFVPTGAMSLARSNGSATLLPDGRVLVAGGMAVSDPDRGAIFSVHVSAELYDPSPGGFSATGSMSLPRDGHSATLLRNGRVLIAGGRTGFAETDGVVVSLTASAELYWPASRPTSPESASPSPAASASARPTASPTTYSLPLTNAASWAGGTAQALVADGNSFYAFIGTAEGPTVWSSTDGSSWSKLADSAAFTGGAPGADKVVIAAAGVAGDVVGGGLVAVGHGASLDGHTLPGLAWYSADGRTWQKARLDVPSAEFSFLASRKGTCVAFGDAPYVSTDGGATWRRTYAAGEGTTPAPSQTPGGSLTADAAGVHTVSAWQGGFIAAPVSGGGPVWTSPDGNSWTRHDDWSIPDGMISISTLRDRGDVLVGRVIAAAADEVTFQASLWWSLDGRSWQPTEIGSDAGLVGLFGIGSGNDLLSVDEAPSPGPLMIVLGEPAGDSGAAPFWTSGDGRSWQKVSQSGMPVESGQYEIALIGSRVVVLGGAGATSAWFGDLVAQ